MKLHRFAVPFALLVNALFAHGQTQPRAVSSLDDAPWRFTELLAQRKSNLSQGRPVTVATDDAKQSLTVDLGQTRQLDSIRFNFPEITLLERAFPDQHLQHRQG